MSDVRSLEDALAGITVGKPALVSCAESLKAEQIALIHERAEYIRTETKAELKPYWKGMAMGEINLLARLEIISLHESYVLRNMISKAAGEREYHGKFDLDLSLKLDNDGVRFR
jgi:hypothetical protein